MEGIVGLSGYKNVETIELGGTCPACRKSVTFQSLHKRPDYIINDGRSSEHWGYRVGNRHCPNPECLQHIVFAGYEDRLNDAFRTIAIWPTPKLDFDTSNVPEHIVETFEEAITCHAERCYRASAMMVRRTIEEICKQQGVTGRDLGKRIESLKSKGTLPPRLLDAMHDIRWLGNDAAHILAKSYSEVGKEESKLAIEITGKMLDYLFQMNALVDKLAERKKSKVKGGDQDEG